MRPKVQKNLYITVFYAQNTLFYKKKNYLCTHFIGFYAVVTD